MKRDATPVLWDARKSVEAVLDYTAGKAFEDYASDRLLRDAVERRLQNTGEAIAQLSRLDPALAARIPDHRAIIAFRNILVHGYAALDDRLVWRVIADDLPNLRTALDALLAERGEG